MRSASIKEELEAITHSYDYGIVPGSATAFHLDEAMGFGRVDLTLLEGVMVIIEVNQQGYKVVSQSALYCGSSAEQATQAIESCVHQPFETMENLLMAISPLFAERFHQVLFQKLSSISGQSPPTNAAIATTTTTTTATATTTTTTVPSAAAADADTLTALHGCDIVPAPSQQQAQYELYPTTTSSHPFVHQPPDYA